MIDFLSARNALVLAQVNAVTLQIVGDVTPLEQVLMAPKATN